jgi:hypothetical protein
MWLWLAAAMARRKAALKGQKHHPPEETPAAAVAACAAHLAGHNIFCALAARSDEVATRLVDGAQHVGLRVERGEQGTC